MTRILLIDDCAPQTIITAASDVEALRALLPKLDKHDHPSVRACLESGSIEMRNHPYHRIVTREEEAEAFWSALCDIATGGTQDWRWLKEGEEIDD